MEITDAKRMVKLQQWINMLQSRQESGLTVKAWCQENKVSLKTYYYRLRSLRLEALSNPEMSNLSKVRTASGSGPVFAELDLSKGPQHTTPICVKLSAVSVRIGPALIEIHNGAEADIIASTLRVMNELC